MEQDNIFDRTRNLMVKNGDGNLACDCPYEHYSLGEQKWSVILKHTRHWKYFSVSLKAFVKIL